MDAPGDIDMLLQRRAEPFVIVDGEARVLASSPGTDLAAFEGHLPELVARHRTRIAADSGVTIAPVESGVTFCIDELVGVFGTVFVVTRKRTEMRRDAASSIASEHNLTNREREVLALLLAGSSNNDIAERLFIAPTTARDHTQNIFRKTGIGKRSALLACAIGYGRSRTSKDA